MIVIDATVLVTALLDQGGDGALARERLLAASALHTPHLADIEVASVLRDRVLGEKLSAARAAQALDDYAQLPLTRHPHAGLLPRIWELRDQLGARDATYVALAESLGTDLLTGDHQLASAVGPRCPIVVLTNRH